MKVRVKVKPNSRTEGLSQEGKGKNMAVKLGIMCSDQELDSETAKYRRYRLKDKAFYGGIDDGEEFGGKLYLKRGGKVALSKAENSRHSSRFLLYGHLLDRLAAHIDEDTPDFQ
jgi:hypothetical protein